MRWGSEMPRVTLPPGVELRPLKWEGCVQPGESLIGLVASRAAEYHMGTTRLMLLGSGIDVRDQGTVAGAASPRQLSSLAEILNVNELEVKALAWESRDTDNAGELVAWGKRTMRLRDLEQRKRKIAPITLKNLGFHRNAWMVRLLPFCPESFEALIDTCPACGRSLRWTSAHGLAMCEDQPGCRYGIEPIEPTGDILPVPLRATYKKFSDLLSCDVDTAELARRSTAQEIAALSNPAFADLIFALGRIERPNGVPMKAYHTLPDGNLEAAHQIDRGMRFVKDWPQSIRWWMKMALQERATHPYKLERLRTLLRTSAGSALHELLIEAVPEIELDRRRAVAADEAPIMLGSELKTRGGFDEEHIKRLGEAMLLDPTVVSIGKRKHIQFDRAHCEALIEANRLSEPGSASAKRLGVPGYAIAQLAEAKHLTNIGNDTLDFLHGEKRVTIHSVNELLKRLAKLATPATPDANSAHLLKLTEALKVLGGGAKPWADIVGLLLEGKIAFHPIPNVDGAGVQALQIPSSGLDNLKKLIGRVGRVAEPPNKINKQDSREILNVSNKVLGSLQQCGVLCFEAHWPGRYADFAEVASVAERRIFLSELMLVSGRSLKQLRNDKRQAGIKKLPGGGWSRTDICDLLSSPLLK